MALKYNFLSSLLTFVCEYYFLKFEFFSLSLSLEINLVDRNTKVIFYISKVL